MHQPIVKMPQEIASQRRTSAWIVLAALACLAALAAPSFLGRVYVADDLGQFHLPLRDFYSRQLARGEPFDWMPSLYGGFYVAAEGQLGAYHPWHWLLYRWLPLSAAFDVELVASYPFLFAGTYLLLGRLVGRRDAALFGALAFTFGGFNLLHFVHPNAIAVVAHLPWLLFAIDVAISTDRAWRRAAATLGVGLLTASQLLLGYPQYAWLSLLAEIAFVAWRAANRQAPLGRVASLALAGAGGVLAGAIQWIPTWHLLAESTRQSADAVYAAGGSLHPLNLVQMLAPYLFATRVVGQNTHELGMYAGAVPVVLCIWLVAHRRQWGPYRPLVRALLVFGAVALWLAAGEFGGLYRLQSWVPFVNHFRFPCRAIVLVQLCLAALAAVAAAILFAQRADAGDAHRQSRSLWFAVLAAAALAIAGPILWPGFVARPTLVWSGPLLIAAAAGLIALAERGVRVAAIGLVLFTAVDLGVYGMSYSVWGRTADLDAYVAGVSRPPDATQLRVAAPDDPNGLRAGDRMLLAGLVRVDGYAGLEPARRLDYRRQRPLQLAGVGWIWQPLHENGDVRRGWVPLAPRASRARLVTATVGDEQLRHIDALGWDVATVDPPLSLPASQAGAARVVADRPGRITIETDAPARQLLVTTESFDPGWRVTLDGRPRAIVRVNGDFLGCPVEPGKHQVQFEFRPRCRDLGVLVSACGLGLMMLAACLSLARVPYRAWRSEAVKCSDRLWTRL